MKKLLLFDIDGTLLISRGAGRKAMKEALASFSSAPIQTDGVDFSGRTDPQIIRDILLKNGMDEAEAHNRLPAALEAYTHAFHAAFTFDMVYDLEGAVKLVEKLSHREDTQLALLTGNLQKTGYLKLKAIGLDQYFPFGAFGSDHENRYELPAVALNRAVAYDGTEYRGKDIVIIGDTKHDILCGRSHDVFSVAVATGHYDSGDLSVHDPDLLLDDLTNEDAFMNAIYG